MVRGPNAYTRAAHGGIVAIAGRGFRGPATVLEERFGLYATHVGSAAFDVTRLTRGLGQEWEAARIAFQTLSGVPF